MVRSRMGKEGDGVMRESVLERMDAAAGELKAILIEWQAARAPFLKPSPTTVPGYDNWTRLSKAEHALAEWIKVRHPMKEVQDA